jgi:hypothetical protein
MTGLPTLWTPARQAEAEEMSVDGLTRTFHLPLGLAFHEGDRFSLRMLSRVNRWATREPMGGTIKASQNERIVVDHRTFRGC